MVVGGKVCVAVLVLVVAASVTTDAAVYGFNNIMYRRYPNGPSEYHRMPVIVYSPRTTPVRTQPDSSWMFQREGHFPASRKF